MKKTDGTNACTLTAASDANPLSFVFTASSGAAVWQRKTLTSTVLHYTRLSDCLKMTVGTNVTSPGSSATAGFSSSTASIPRRGSGR